MASITVAQGAYQAPYYATHQPVIQNLGPGTLYIGAVSTNILTEGLQLLPGAVYEFPAIVQDGVGAIWVQAETATCDVRFLNVG